METAVVGRAGQARRLKKGVGVGAGRGGTVDLPDSGPDRRFAGAQCAACTSAQTCNTQTLACEGGSSVSDGGFFPGGTFCDPNDPTTCPGGCCDADPSSGLGVCATVGDTCALAPLDLSSIGLGQIQFGCMFAASFGTECTCKQSGSTYACGL